MANRNWASGGKLYSMHVKPVLLDCNFVVNSGEGDGVEQLKGPCVEAVYMHSTSPSDENPNPQAGTIMVKLTDKYSRLFSADASLVAALSGTDIDTSDDGVIAGKVYVITDVGDVTQEQWESIGVPAGVTAENGLVFVATVTGTTDDVGQVQVPATTGSGIDHVELIDSGDQAVQKKSYLVLNCYKDNALTAPTDGAKIMLKLLLSDSSVLIGGE